MHVSLHEGVGVCLWGVEGRIYVYERHIRKVSICSFAKNFSSSVWRKQCEIWGILRPRNNFRHSRHGVVVSTML